ncbi:DUF2496 domain-containing protein [Pragia fontium]|uniref:DUF2496 domain-containing protein n=2 Tax=Pragia fontium TaxID=82985 RepID=A0AAJ4W8T2_9GAMM|nr:DUF2496 domain-containing protein [Pragia fontium]AKJ41705.1 primosomal protein [Pragia fontium]SFC34163.1 Protein of unknown function [Pragia fontium DSM 5563 = ATCC 49100]SUB81932.1 Protein of uncharacterised function (DUF2496) [Pragia fontium]VEJ54510.1 Protein of uncharacterised function (DUF2496) [Pragia fontium]GKX62212.1 primosomal protein [Pragia fontium]
MAQEQEPVEITLAVDLIYLLETSEIDPRTVLTALKIVERDFIKKVDALDNPQQ